jgi:hypothetical protein
MHQFLETSTRAIRATAMAFAAVVIFGAQANAATDIAYWNVDGLSITANSLPGSGGAPNSFSATAGTGTLYLSPDHTTVAGTGVKGAVDDAAGSALNNPVVNAITPTGATSLILQNGVTGNALVGNGEYIEVEFPMSGESNIGVSYATYASSASAFNSDQWSYSTNGTTFTNFESPVTIAGAPGPNHITVGGFSLVGPLIATGLNGFSGTAYLRYTYSGASGTSATPSNRLDNLRVQSGASPQSAPNAASLPLGGDIVFGLNNIDPANTLEFVRGSASPSGGVRFPAPTYQYTTPSVATPAPLPFLEAVKFDNSGGVAHNANGNLLGINFGASSTAGGQIYSLATTGSTSSPAAQLIGATNATTPIGSAAGAVTSSRLAGLSVSPDNSKIAVVGTDAGKVIVYDYTAGNTAGTGASLTGGRQSATALVTVATQGTVWKNNSTVIAFSSSGNLIEVDGTSMAVNDVGVATNDVVVPFNTSPYSSIAYNPAISPYVYALWSGFATAANPSSQTRLYVFDPANNYQLLTTQTDANTLKGVDLSLSSQTGRDIALDKNGNLFIGGFDSTITYMPAADFANPATIAAIPSGVSGISTFYYQSTYNATAFPGMDIGFAPAGLTGDYNADGKVNAQDYVIWRKTNINGAQGYTDWRSNYGTGGPGAGAGLDGASVPEPASLVLLVIGLAAFCSRRRSA